MIRARRSLTVISWNCIDIARLMRGSDADDQSQQIQDLFNSGLLEGRYAKFTRDWNWRLASRPTAVNNTYFTLPQNCVLEWERAWNCSEMPDAGAPIIMGRRGSLGSQITVTSSLARGANTIPVSSGQAASLVYGNRLMLRCTTKQESLVGAFTFADNTGVEITASISGTTLTVTDAGTASLDVGTNIVASGVSANTIITALDGTGTGGTGTYTVSVSQTVSSRTMTSYSGKSARAEDVRVKSVSGDTITLMEPLRDNYDSTALPVLQLYQNEPDIHLINPMADGPGLGGGGTNDDRFCETRACKRFVVEGGTISNFSQALRTYSPNRGYIKDLTMNGIKAAAPGGGLVIGGNTQGYLIEGCVSHGGAQMFMLSANSDSYGVTRDVVFRDCWAHGPTTGFITHNTHEGVIFDGCHVRGNSTFGIDIRAPNCRVMGGSVENGTSRAVRLRVGSNGTTIDGLHVRNNRGGIDIDDTPNEIDYWPGDYSITNCRFENMSGASARAINLDFPVLDGSSYPVLGRVTIANNFISMGDNNIPIHLRGRWTEPTVVRNHIAAASGATPTGRSIFIGPPEVDGAPEGSGPINPTIADNTIGSTFAMPAFSDFTGRYTYERTSIPGVTGSEPVSLTTDTTLLAEQSGMTFNNLGAAGDIVVTLPDNPRTREPFRVVVLAAHEIDIQSSDLVQIRVGDATPALNLRSNVVGAWAEISVAENETDPRAWTVKVDDPANWTQDWSPWALGADLLLWWDVKRPPSDSNSGFRWKDAVTGFVLRQTTTALKPSYDGTSVNFSGNRYLENQTPSSALPDNADAGDIYASVIQTRDPGTDTNNRIIFSFGAQATDSRAIGRTVVGGVNRAFILMGDGAAKTATETTVDFTGTHWVSSLYDGADAYAEINGTASSALTVTTTTVVTRVRMGANALGTAGDFWMEKIKRVLVTANLSGGNRASLETWLDANK